MKKSLILTSIFLLATFAFPALSKGKPNIQREICDKRFVSLVIMEV